VRRPWVCHMGHIATIFVPFLEHFGPFLVQKLAKIGKNDQK